MDTFPGRPWHRQGIWTPGDGCQTMTAAEPLRPPSVQSCAHGFPVCMRRLSVQPLTCRPPSWDRVAPWVAISQRRLERPVVARRFSYGDAYGSPDSCLPGSLVELAPGARLTIEITMTISVRLEGTKVSCSMRSAATVSRLDQMPRNVQFHLILVPAKRHTD
jgi:hypothetical protein